MPISQCAVPKEELEHAMTLELRKLRQMIKQCRDKLSGLTEAQAAKLDIQVLETLSAVSKMLNTLEDLNPENTEKT